MKPPLTSALAVPIVLAAFGTISTPEFSQTQDLLVCTDSASDVDGDGIGFEFNSDVGALGNCIVTDKLRFAEKFVSRLTMRTLFSIFYEGFHCLPLAP